jgi:hypothetical protein
MYQKYNLSHFACLGYILLNFGGYRYGIKLTLHRQSEFSSVFRFVFKNLSRNITHQNSHKRSISDIHGCNQSITKSTLLGEQSLNLHIHMTKFSSNSTSHTSHACATNEVSLVCDRAITNGTSLGQQTRFSSVFRLRIEEFF